MNTPSILFLKLRVYTFTSKLPLKILLLALLPCLSWGQADPEPVDLELIVQNQNIQVDDIFTLEIEVRAGALEVDAVEVHLDFDPAFLEIQSIDITALLPVTLVNPAFDNNTGTIDFAVGTFSNLPSGTFMVATIEVKALQSTGDSPALIDFAPLDFPRITAITGGGQNLLDDLINTAVNIAGVTGGDVVVSGTICTQTWTAANTYQLDGLVFVTSGCVLTIEPGTVVKGLASPSNGDPSSALIITRGGTLIADGTAESPIIFTAESDDLSDAFDRSLTDQGLWGGLFILGSGILNTPASGNNGTFIEDQVQGVPADRAALAVFGGLSNSGSSGILRYLSIRHAGAGISASDNVASVALLGVGDGTIVENIESFASGGDGIQLIGGAVNVKFASVAYASDDAFDSDQGYQGRGQFWFGLASNETNSNRLLEFEGATDPETAAPFASPKLSNATLIGKGIAPVGETELVIFSDNSGGFIQNSLFCESNSGIFIELNFNEILNSNTQLNGGNLGVRSSNFGGGTLFVPAVAFNITAENCENTDVNCNTQLNASRNVSTNVFNASNNTLTPTCAVQAINRNDNSGALDPRTTATQPTNFTGVFDDTFFTIVSYQGAFGPSEGDFWAGWSHLAERNILTTPLQD